MFLRFTHRYWFHAVSTTGVVTGFTIVKSKRLADFIDALSDERIGWSRKRQVLRDVW